MPKVVVIYKTIPQYRARFFELLREKLMQLGIEFVLIYGQPGSRDALKKDTVDFPWAIKVPNHIWKIGGREIYWQPVLGYLKSSDLVIVEQASKLLINYVLFVLCMMGAQKLAFWGHGKSFQEKYVSRFGEWIKRLVSTKVHWWFAYNEMSAKVVEGMGYSPERITSVQNAIDTRQLTAGLQNLSTHVVEQLRKDLNIQSNNVALYIGSMYYEKRIPFLLKAIYQIRQQVPDFEMLFIGSGEDAVLVKQAALKYSWIHFIGPKFNTEKIPYFALSKLLLLPSLVGLAILDAFALEVPLVTKNEPYHGPEISYLQDGVNGIMVHKSSDVQIYADAVVSLLLDETRRYKLVEGCRIAREYYTVENMVEHFVQGVLKALES